MHDDSRYQGIYESVRLWLERTFTVFDRIFNRVFTSEFNPLYRSGTIAVALLSLVTVTGLILVFYYRLGEPYESVTAIHSQAWLGRWIRTLHRYASDAAVLAVIIHIFRMFAQKKSWGRRAFAWCVGVLLLGFLMISGWTGFVMVWDLQGQALAIAGAKILDAVQIFVDPIARSFDGSVSQPPASFFFLNLFLHIAIPLSMTFGIWVHTAKMARATWFPHKRIFIALSLLLIFISILWPVSLADKADLLKVPLGYSKDLFFNFWLPWTDQMPGWVAAFWLLIMLGLFALPFILKRKKSLRPKPSDLDEKKCHGCTQCVVDCPYEAIQMVPRKSEPYISDLVALVDPAKCVSCGLCAASCSPMTIGPPTRKGSDQYQTAKSFVRNLLNMGAKLGKQTVVIGCTNQSFTVKQLGQYIEESENLHLYPVACMGNLHMATIGYLATYFNSVLLAACPERNCTNKDAFLLLRERLSGVREPGLPARVDASRIRLLSVGEGEEEKAFRFLENPTGSETHTTLKKRDSFKATIGGILFFLGIAFLSQVSTRPAPSKAGLLRLSWRLAGQTVKDCQKRTPQELASLPIHMRTSEICAEKKLAYRLILSVDGKSYIEKIIRPGGFRSDRPLYVAENLELPEGKYQVIATFEPAEEKVVAEAVRLRFEHNIRVTNGEVALIYLSSEQQQLLLKQKGLP